ncbi:putative sugar transporter [Mycena sanguinolenta]|uniref:Putative sugar transporter n=1 Tax=Mycena sanguinolenta TaxID=230812 RepID=A0A8H6Y6W5_9AGAR|nr:putative sugar transporter [Mycena sanguinolenta]
MFSAVNSGLAQTWPQLFVYRLLLRLGMGCKASTVPVYAAENTSASIRGGLVMSWQRWASIQAKSLDLFFISWFYCLETSIGFGFHSRDSSASEYIFVQSLRAGS